MKTEALEEGKTIVSSDDWQMANDMIDRLATCGLLDTYLAGDYQVGFLEELNGVQVKGFLDCLGDGFISDSKSARSAEKFRYAVRDFCYDIQAYIYCEGLWNQGFLLGGARENISLPTSIGKVYGRNIIHGGDESSTMRYDRIRQFLNEKITTP